MSMSQESQRLGNILIASGKLTDLQLQAAIERQRDTEAMLGDVFVELDFVTPEDIALALSQQLGIPYYELGEDFRLEQEEVHLVPESMVRKFCLVPLKAKSKELTVTLVMKDPLDIEAAEAVRALTNLEIHKAVSTEQRITAVIDKFYRADAHIERNLRAIMDLEADPSDEVETGGDELNIDANQLRVQANDAPVIRFVNLILMEAIRDRASDIHFEPGEKTVSVRCRVDGVLHDVTPPPKHLYQAVVTRIKILSSMDIAERRLPLDGRFKFSVGERMIDVRVSSLPQVFGEKLVLRILDRSSLLVDMRDIGFDDEMLNDFQRILRMPHGIVLLTGPTGSGKTTTLYSALQMLKSRTKNIQTVEDPVEYMIEGINQVHVRANVGLTFAAALRAILRQDPDIILLGEIRDLETAQIAMQASLTGHIVLSTLHTNDAPSAFSRLTDIGVPPYLSASTVRVVVAQRLVRRLCSICRQAVEPDQEMLGITKTVFPGADTWTYYKPGGCRECKEYGYRGRIAIAEYLPMSDGIRQLRLDHAGEIVMRTRAMELGMETLLQNGLRKVGQGISTVEEVLSACPLELEAQLIDG